MEWVSEMSEWNEWMRRKWETPRFPAFTCYSFQPCMSRRNWSVDQLCLRHSDVHSFQFTNTTPLNPLHSFHFTHSTPFVERNHLGNNSKASFLSLLSVIWSQHDYGPILENCTTNRPQTLLQYPWSTRYQCHINVLPPLDRSRSQHIPHRHEAFMTYSSLIRFGRPTPST